MFSIAIGSLYALLAVCSAFVSSFVQPNAMMRADDRPRVVILCVILNFFIFNLNLLDYNWLISASLLTLQ